MSFANTFSFSLVYYLLTLFAIESSFFVAFSYRQKFPTSYAHRFAITFGVLGVFRLIFPLVSLIFVGQTIQFEQVLVVISLGLLAWGFSPYFRNHPFVASTFIVINTSLVCVLLVVVVITTINISTLLLAWQLIIALLIIGSIAYKFNSNQVIVILAMLVFIIGSFAQLLLEPSQVFWVRLAEMIVYPMLWIAVYQDMFKSITVPLSKTQHLSAISHEQMDGLIDMFKATTHFTSSLDVDTIVDSAAESMVKTIEADLGAIILAEKEEPSQLRMRTIHNPCSDGRIASVLFPRNQNKIIKHALDNTTQVVINTIEDENPHIAFIMAMMGAEDEIGPLIFQPLILADKAIGIVIVGNPFNKRIFTYPEIELMKVIANYIAIAIGNAQTYNNLLAKSKKLRWTLRNHDLDASRRSATLEAELDQSRKTATMLLQQLAQQEKLVQEKESELLKLKKRIAKFEAKN